MGVRVTRTLALCVCFVDHCLSFCPVSFGLSVVCHYSINGFWLTLWYFQTRLNKWQPEQDWNRPLQIYTCSSCIFDDISIFFALNETDLLIVILFFSNVSARPYIAWNNPYSYLKINLAQLHYYHAKPLIIDSNDNKYITFLNCWEQFVIYFSY